MSISPSICTKLRLYIKPPHYSSISFLRPLSSSSSPYPLYYELIDHRPVRTPRSKPKPAITEPEPEPEPEMDRAKRKYYRKRYARMYGSSDSDSETSVSRKDDEFVELKPEIIDFHRLHAREQELYFYDAFAFPWEKEKHYRMVYQLEKKYFPDQCLDKAFVDPDTDIPDNQVKNEKGLVFFEEEGKEEKEEEKKSVKEFFKCLKKVPNESGRGEKKRNVAVRARGVEEEIGAMPVLVSRRTEFPARWDGAHGTVVLVDKPKGWTSFTVCGKLRRLVKVQKVGHAGTLDPMATGLLIVCVGKATKIVDKYQGMVKGYSGVFRLGEATSTWDADSPVIQREPWEHIKDDDIRKTAKSFVGDIWQVPPMFSAIKVKGEKMYDKARRGETVELSPRRISIFQFDIERSLDDRQNLIFRVTCSKGTYIRSLCADLGKALGSCAHLTALRRDSIGEYTADDAWSFQEIEDHITKGYF